MDATLARTPPPPAAASAAACIPGWLGCRAEDADGAQLGRVADVLFDERTRAPGWVLLARGQRLALAPAHGLRHLADGVRLGCTRARLDAAPAFPGPPDSLTQRHAHALAAHFGVRCGRGPWAGAVTPSIR